MSNEREIKKDFPIFDPAGPNAGLVYLDSGASAQKPRAVIDAIARFYGEGYANIHRGVYKPVSYTHLAIDGPLDITSCSSDATHRSCERAELCGTQPHWRRIKGAVTAALASVSLADMALPLPLPEAVACCSHDFSSLSLLGVQP